MLNLLFPADTREPYLRTGSGAGQALRVTGRRSLTGLYNLPAHENYIHDGTGHQNEAVDHWSRLEWVFGFIPVWRKYRDHYYPLTDNGRPINLDALQYDIEHIPLEPGQAVEIVEMPARIERRAIQRESKEQKARGVPFWRLWRRGL